MNPRARRDDVRAADGTRLALHRTGDDAATPVLLVAGTFSNHSFWLGTRGHGMAWSLAEVGFGPVVLDPRGHGDSERPDGRAWNMDHWGRLDVPAAIGAITAADRPAFLVGHSAGGAAILIALAGEPALRDRVAGVVLLATPVPWLQGLRRVAAWTARAGSRLLGRFPARSLGLGPEDEMPGVMSQWMTWNLRGTWLGDDGTDYVRRLADVRLPLLAISGAGDTVFAPPAACRGLVEMVGSPDRDYRLAGRETGFGQDYDHPGIVVSRAARSEVWPLIADWIRRRDLRADGRHRGLPDG